ncbi:MAG: hypothetical protein M1820_000885 [Bogoriella megaspora]|nr:MAG: hypothetical protein M1820_000885 [Bogoriella megaspora]
MTSNLIRDQGFGATDDVPSYTARFNFTDLNTPVPASIYDRQPWCVSWLTSKMAYSDSMVLYQSFFASINSTCPQTRPYDPVLVVPLQSIQAIDPLWSNCSFDIRGAFDPPYDLHHASVAAAPTPATQTLSISATPASAPQTSQPAETGSGNVITSVTALLPSASTSPFGASNDPHTSSSLPQGPRSSSVKPGSIRPQPADPSQSPQSTVMGEGSKAGGIIASLLSSSQGSTPGSSPEPVAPVVSSASPGDAETTVPDAGSHAGGGIASIFVGNSAVLSNTLPEAGNTEDSVPNRVSSAASVITSEQQAESGAGIATSSSNEPGTDSAKGGDPINNSPATSYLTIQFSQGEDPTVPSRTELAPSASGVVFTASGSTYTAQATNLADGSSQLIVPLGPSSTILSVSGPAATIGGQVIGAAPDGVIISGSSQGLNLIPASPIVNSGLLSPSDAVFSIGGTPYTAIQTNLAGSSVEVVVPFGSTSATLVQGGPAATIDGQQISAIGNGIIIGSSASSANVAPFTISGSTYTAVQSGAPGRPGEVIIPMSSNSAILSVGGPAATILGQAVSAASNGLAVGSTTVAYEEPVPVQSAAPFTISGTPYTVFETFGPGNQPEAIVPMGSSSITLTPGGAIATINGQTLSAGSDGIVVGSSTARYSANPAHSQVVAPFTISGIPYTALESTLSGQNNEVLVPLGSSTLTLVPGGSATTLGGQILSAAPSGIVVDRTTKPWLQYSDNQPSTEEGTTQLVAPFTLSESPYTAIETNIPGPGNGVIIPLGTTSATLSAGGPATTIDGHAISAASNGIVVDGSTEAFTPSIFTLGTSETIAPFTISGSAYTAFETSIPGLGEEIVIPISGSKITLSPGGSDATVGGEVISAVSTGIVVGGTTKGFRTVAGDGGLFGSSAVAETIAPFQVSGIQYTAFETSVSGEGDEIVIPVGTREITLSPGGPDATIGGEVVSAVDSELVVGGSTDSFVTITGSDIPLATGPTPGYGNGNGDEGGSAASSAGAPAFMKMSWRGKASEPGVWVVAASIACALVG